MQRGSSALTTPWITSPTLISRYLSENRAGGPVVGGGVGLPGDDAGGTGAGRVGIESGPHAAVSSAKQRTDRSRHRMASSRERVRIGGRVV